MGKRFPNPARTRNRRLPIISSATDVPFSEEIFTRLGDTYRRIRNTLRILLGNLYDFQSGKQESRKDFSLIDRWILERLDDVVQACRSAYENFEFHKVYHTLNQFCAVDLSSLYIDITKDRMYCDPPDSPRRRATQTAMYEIFDALSKLLAPVLVFTAEEAWRHSAVVGIGDAGQQESLTPPTTSIHIQEFPDLQNRGREAIDQVEGLLRLRGIVGQAIEQARQEKLIGNTLEARVVLNSDSDVTEKITKEELEEFFILSDLTINLTKEASVSVTKTPYK